MGTCRGQNEELHVVLRVGDLFNPNSKTASFQRSELVFAIEFGEVDEPPDEAIVGENLRHGSHAGSGGEGIPRGFVAIAEFDLGISDATGLQQRFGALAVAADLLRVDRDLWSHEFILCASGLRCASAVVVLKPVWRPADLECAIPY